MIRRYITGFYFYFPSLSFSKKLCQSWLVEAEENFIFSEESSPDPWQMNRPPISKTRETNSPRTSSRTNGFLLLSHQNASYPHRTVPPGGETVLWGGRRQPQLCEEKARRTHAPWATPWPQRGQPREDGLGGQAGMCPSGRWPWGVMSRHRAAHAVS